MEISIPTLLRIKPNALYKIGKYLRKENFKKIALFYGEGMREMLSETINISLDSSEISVDTEKTVTDNCVDAIFKENFPLPQGTNVIVAVGGGKVIDYCKYLGFISQIPVISVSTSISNDAMASPGASLTVNGVRRSLKARIPYGVIMDTNIIKNSPARFTYSGIGDLISKYTAIYDWKLSYRATGEAVNDFAVLISNNSVENVVNYKNKNVADVEFLRLVSGCLVMSGVAMEVSRSSRPASGSEHLISHAYDKISKKPSLHGIQVGIATYAISWLQKNDKHELIKSLLNETGFAEFAKKNPLNKQEFIEAIKIAPSIKENYYTILSEKGAIEKLLEFTTADEYLNKFIA
ncbi:MAG: iron-containing alcohol dehydrogenase family protein [Candidatus Wallbacteria bacterium]